MASKEIKTLERITSQSSDFTKWYDDVVFNAELMKYGLVKGTMFLEPYGQAIWDRIRTISDKLFREQGVSNVSFPLVFPYSELQKEKDHVEGFAPEVLLITQAGDKKLDEWLVVRPTSEILFCHYFKQKVNSLSDLPVLINQWCSVMRWEKTTRPFLRNSEFHWQEGHTVHSSENEAKKFAKTMHVVYQKIINESLLLPVIVGTKSPAETFAGAVETYTVETMTKDGKALQAGTSHYLGQGFAKAFDIKFQNSKNAFEHVYQTSWGISTRLIGALIMTHGDDKGLVLPPQIAPYEIVIMELFADKSEKVSKVATQLYNKLSKKYRVYVDKSDKSIGAKSANWEIKGVPIRIEVGPRDLENNKVTIVKRTDGSKELIDLENALTTIKEKLIEVEIEIKHGARFNFDNRLIKTSDLSVFEKEYENGRMFLVDVCIDDKLEGFLKEKYQLAIRCINKSNTNGKCIFTGKDSTHSVYVARSY